MRSSICVSVRGMRCFVRWEFGIGLGIGIGIDIDLVES